MGRLREAVPCGVALASPYFEHARRGLQGRDVFEFKSWKQAANLQVELAGLVVEETPSDFKPRRICGLDVAYRGPKGFASAVLWDLESEQVLATSHAVDRVSLGYLPGFLGFREGPLILSAARTLAPL